MSEINMILSDIETISEDETISDNDSFEVLNEQDLLALKRNRDIIIVVDHYLFDLHIVSLLFLFFKQWKEKFLNKFTSDYI
jgi:hypothetical protein